MECGEGKQKEGEEIVLCVCCYWTEAESDREKHSVFFGTHPTHSVFFGTHPTHSRRDFEHNNPSVVHRTPTVGAVVWFRKDRLGRCLQVNSCS